MKKILDHGYLSVVEHWGSDERIIESARMSTGKGFLGWSCWKCRTCGSELERVQIHSAKPGEMCSNDATPPEDRPTGAWERTPRDEKLLRFLWENKHSTPFEMAGATFEVQAPIFVFREWHRHRVPFGYSELSARYTPLPDVNYIPSIERLMIGSDGKNKQAGTIAGAEVLSEATAKQWNAELQTLYTHAQQVYNLGLKLGVPKELARLPVPVARYSRMRATGNLRGWLGFLALRNAPSAQYEIRMYAAALQDELAALFPRTLALFAEGRP